VKLSSGTRGKAKDLAATEERSVCNRLKGDDVQRFTGAVRRATVLAGLQGEKFQNRSPAILYVTLLDEGEYAIQWQVLGLSGELK
jgi:hypothetical protein